MSDIEREPGEGERSIVRTYSLAEVAAMVCGDELKDPELWLLRRVRSGKVSALKISRGHYRFTTAQVDALLAQMDTTKLAERPKSEAAPVTFTPGSLRGRPLRDDGLSPGSRRRLRRTES